MLAPSWERAVSGALVTRPAAIKNSVNAVGYRCFMGICAAAGLVWFSRTGPGPNFCGRVGGTSWRCAAGPYVPLPFDWGTGPSGVGGFFSSA